MVNCHVCGRRAIERDGFVFCVCAIPPDPTGDALPDVMGMECDICGYPFGEHRSRTGPPRCPVYPVFRARTPPTVSLDEVAIALAPFAMQSLGMNGKGDPKEYVTISVRRETLTKADELLTRIKERQ